jgi:hypothetical protein
VASGVTTRRGSQERNAGTDGKHPMLDPRAEAGPLGGPWALLVGRCCFLWTL